jgi:CxxC-x17-CxxC domain-containing protein
MIDMQLQDTTLTCGECGQEFTYTAGEQLSSARRGQSKPSRCAFCRAARMIAGGARNHSGGNNSEHQMYPAVCSNCGKQTQVPFEPRGYRPVYCSDCYRLQRENSSGGGYDGARTRTGSYHRA